MARNQVSEQLYNLIRSLLSFASIVYKLYKPYIKCVLISLIAYAAFKVGRMSIIDPLSQSVGKLWHILQTRADYTIYLPERIKKVARIRKILLFMLILSAALWLVVYSFKIKSFKKIKVKYMLLYGVTIVTALTLSWIYEMILNVRVKEGKTEDMTINQKLYALQKELGPRVQGILKIFLCKEQVIRRASSPQGVCVKDNCQKYRQLLKQKTDGIQYLVNSALNFSWCYICRKKMPFNEFIQFQNKPYASEDIPQQEQIVKKNNFLLQELLRMTQWAKDTAPCNCSQIYWGESLRYIKQYKRKQKQIDKALLFYESSQKFKRI